MNFYGLMPTPIASDFMDGTAELRKDTGKQRVDSLKHLMAALTHPNPSEEAQKIGEYLGMLPTPITSDSQGGARKIAESGRTLRKSSGENFSASLKDLMVTRSESGGITSRLSPLFTEEMMGFPFLWTALPFLQFPNLPPTAKETPSDTHSQSGAPKPSKPTATPSSPKSCTKSSEPSSK